jgi:hypothetical protein
MESKAESGKPAMAPIPSETSSCLSTYPRAELFLSPWDGFSKLTKVSPILLDLMEIRQIMTDLAWHEDCNLWSRLECAL